MIMIHWKSILKYLNCLKFTKDGGKKLNFDDFVEKNTGIQKNRGYIRNIAGNPLDVGFTKLFSGVQRCFRYSGR
jgi:hypothetical protein